jgi:cardiolipin synthase A/B
MKFYRLSFAALAAVLACSAPSETQSGDVSQVLPPAPENPVVVAPDPDAGVKGSAPACMATDARTAPLTLHTFPEAGEAPFVEPLLAARSSIRVMVYMMGYGGILDALTQKARAGVKVEVILDGTAKLSTNQKYYDLLTAAGASVRWSDPKWSYMHAKVLLIDDAVAVISTGNYAKSYMLKERNYAVTNRDPSDVAVLRSLFDADFSGTEPDLSCTRLLVAPQNAKPRLLELIQSATTSIDVESMQFAERDIQQAIFERKRAGVTVRVLLADAGWIDSNVAAGKVLADNAIEARQLLEPSIHVKAIVVDGKRAYLGSENLSFTSLTKNREVGVVSEQPEVVGEMVQVFDRDWKAGKAL